MSRIHEALKRAEQERNLQDVAIPAMRPPAVEAATAAQMPPLGVLDPLVFPEFSAPRQPVHEFLRFDDVWNNCAQPGWTPDLNHNVFSNPDAPASAAEQFRTLRSRLYHAREKQPLRTVLVTSALESEGKTFVAGNLALALARQQGCRVLLIDADLRRPSLHAILGAPSATGLSNYLSGEVDEIHSIQRGVQEYLCLIAGGTHTDNPAELLSNGRLKTLLEKMAPVFDWVILDSPPTLPVSDAMVIADVCDGVLAVVRGAYTDYDCAQKSCQQLKEKNLLGIVLNCAEENHAYGPYYYRGASANGNHVSA